MLSFLILVSSSALADSSSASVFVPPSYCNVSTDTSNDIPHIATINNGTYKEDIGTTTFSVFCGDTGGFSVYAIGYSGEEFGNTKLLATVGGSLSPSNDIVTGTATSGDTSQWAMKATPVSGVYTPTIENGFSNYSPIPDTYTKIATFPSVTDTSNGSSFTTTYKAYISKLQPAGTYSGKVRYTLVHPNVTGITLSEAYAMVGKQKVGEYYALQDMNPDICAIATIFDEGSQMQAIDIRDNKVYWITKLQDGHCWMTQNLDLNLDSAKTYTHDDTDLGWGSDTATTSWTPVRSTIVATNSIAGWTNDNNTPYSVDPGDYYWKNLPFYPSTNCYPSNNVQYCSYITKGAGWSTYFATTPYKSNGTHGHVGNKYNWPAAVANNNASTYTANTSNNIVNNPQNSICPAGWRLPTISGQTPAYTADGSLNEFARIAYLYDNYTGNFDISSEGLEKAPFYMIRPGYIDKSILQVAGYGEYYWTSTVFSNTYAGVLWSNSEIIRPEHEDSRYFGFSIRCLAR